MGLNGATRHTGVGPGFGWPPAMWTVAFFFTSIQWVLQNPFYRWGNQGTGELQGHIAGRQHSHCSTNNQSGFKADVLSVTPFFQTSESWWEQALTQGYCLQSHIPYLGVSLASCWCGVWKSGHIPRPAVLRRIINEFAFSGSDSQTQ